MGGKERKTLSSSRRLNFHDGHPRYFARGFVFLPPRTRNLARILGTWHAFNIMGKRVLRGISLEAGSETVKRWFTGFDASSRDTNCSPAKRPPFFLRSLSLVEEKRFFSIIIINVINKSSMKRVFESRWNFFCDENYFNFLSFAFCFCCQIYGESF